MTFENLKMIENETRKALPHSDFLNDIADLMQKLVPSAYHVNEFWSIDNSDDPQDLFLCGTEVLGCCQKIGGDVDKNRALMGYVLDGKYRILAIKDPSGKIVG